MATDLIGIMSGSSMDGLDMALCRFEVKDGNPDWSLLRAQTIPFPAHLQQALQSAPVLSGFELMKLDAVFGKFIGTEIKSWIEQFSLKADAIASHGHTIFHEPSQGFTTQIGSGAHIALMTGIDTITSFRAADVAAGGQGAPFAPVADKALFPGYQAYLNLGGIANITMLTPGGNWRAHDIGPCNQALNHLARKEGQAFDRDGKLAEAGTVIDHVVADLIAMFPYDNGQPKGLSNAEVQSTWIQYLDATGENVIDLLASVSEAIAILICNNLVTSNSNEVMVLVSGGGAHNAHLMRRLLAHSADRPITYHLPTDDIINFKECVLMAWLGYLTMRGLPYGIAEMTGASVDTIGGALFKAKR